METGGWSHSSHHEHARPLPCKYVSIIIAAALSVVVALSWRQGAQASGGAGVVLAGAGTAAANDWLPIFRTEEVAAIGLDSADLVALPDLEAYGDVVMTGDDDLRSVPDAATAEAESGLDVPEVLRSGDHGRIARWRRTQSLLRTAARRPDMFAAYPGELLDKKDRAALEEGGFQITPPGVAK